MPSFTLKRKSRQRTIKLRTAPSVVERRRQDFIPLNERELHSRQEGSAEEDASSLRISENADHTQPESEDTSEGQDLANKVAEPSGRTAHHQSHQVRKQREEENYQAYRPEALKTSTTGTCRALVSDRYKAISDLTKDFTLKAIQVGPLCLQNGGAVRRGTNECLVESAFSSHPSAEAADLTSTKMHSSSRRPVASIVALGLSIVGKRPLLSQCV